MVFDSFAARDLFARDQLPADLVDATPPGNEQLTKGSAATPVAVLIEVDVQTVAA